MFIVVGLPRSRTAWLAEFLSAGGWKCYHEPSRFFTGLKDLRAFLHLPRKGAADAMMCLLRKEILERNPHTRFVVVRRDRKDVEESIKALNRWTQDVSRFLDVMERHLDGFRDENTLTVDYEELGSEDRAGELFEFCTRTPFDLARYRILANRRITADVAAVERDCKVNEAGIERLYGKIVRGEN